MAARGRPHRPRPARRRDLDAIGGVGKRPHVDLEPSRLVRFIRQPFAVRRERGIALGGFRLQRMSLKQHVAELIRQQSERLIELSHRIHAHPELGFEEVRSSAWVAESLSAAGFDVRMGVCDLPTAFSAARGSGALHVGLCAEYDSLPGIGHACGHNIIAASAVGAAIGLAARRRRRRRAGARAGHAGRGSRRRRRQDPDARARRLRRRPRGDDGAPGAARRRDAAPASPRRPSTSHYTGKAAHAATYPELGVNAADALTVAQTAIGLLRQHIRSTDRVHGIVTHGGDAPNIVPARTAARYMARASTPRRAAGAAAPRAPLLRGGRAGDGRDARDRRRQLALRRGRARRRDGGRLSAQRRGARPPLSRIRPGASSAPPRRPTWATCRGRSRRSIR